MPRDSIDLSAFSTPRLANEACELIRSIEIANEQAAGWLFTVCRFGLAGCAITFAMAIVVGNAAGILLPAAVVLVVVVSYPGWRWRRALHASSRLAVKLRTLERELGKRRGRHG
jgi:hypothetical protein